MAIGSAAAAEKVVLSWPAAAQSPVAAAAAGLEALGLLLDDVGGAGRVGRIGGGDLGRLDDFFFGPVNTGDVGALVESERGVVAEKFGDGAGVGGAEEQRVLGGRAGIQDDGDRRIGKPGEQTVANLFRGFHGARGRWRKKERERWT
jgi:hypothetical protein